MRLDSDKAVRIKVHVSKMSSNVAFLSQSRYRKISTIVGIDGGDGQAVMQENLSLGDLWRCYRNKGSLLMRPQSAVDIYLVLINVIRLFHIPLALSNIWRGFNAQSPPRYKHTPSPEPGTRP